MEELLDGVLELVRAIERKHGSAVALNGACADACQLAATVGAVVNAIFKDGDAMSERVGALAGVEEALATCRAALGDVVATLDPCGPRTNCAPCSFPGPPAASSAPRRHEYAAP